MKKSRVHASVLMFEFVYEFFKYWKKMNFNFVAKFLKNIKIILRTKTKVVRLTFFDTVIFILRVLFSLKNHLFCLFNKSKSTLIAEMSSSLCLFMVVMICLRCN
mgnify:CR=1 FL=1